MYVSDKNVLPKDNEKVRFSFTTTITLCYKFF